MKTIARLAAMGLVAAACSRGMNASGSDGWISLFDGQTLSGWRANENPGTFRVENLPALGDDERGQLLEIEAGGERASQLVEEFQPAGAARLHGLVSSPARPPGPRWEGCQMH